MHSTDSHNLSAPHRITSRLTARPVVAIWGIVAVILCFFLCFGAVKVAGLYDEPVSTTTVTLQATPSLATQATEPIQTCVPYSATLLPSVIDLSHAPEGLTRLIDPPNRYQIYGTTASTLRSQIRQCAPKSSTDDNEFTAQTSYRLTWTYSIEHVNRTQCHVTHIKVGLHVGQIIPLWQPTTTADAGLADTWQNFMSALAAHENGHAALDSQHAQIMLNDLHAFPVTKCDLIASSVKHLLTSDVATLDQANDNYDSSTDHGASQGAILP